MRGPESPNRDAAGNDMRLLNEARFAIGLALIALAANGCSSSSEHAAPTEPDAPPAVTCVPEIGRWEGHRPPTNVGYASATDTQRGRLVLHDRFDRANTWYYAGNAWKRLDAAHLPTAIGPIVFDDARGRLVLFGSTVGDSTTGETWIHGGSDWIRITTATTPRARFHHNLVYDVARDRVVLFGGVDSGGTTFDETWEFDGVDWRRVTTTIAAPIGQTNSVYDRHRQRTVVFVSSRHETWEFDGANWTKSAAVTPNVNYPALTYDPIAKRVVSFGGEQNNTMVAETWEYDGAAWSNVSGATSPPVRAGGVMGFDPSSSRLVLFGGHRPRGGLPL